MCLEDGDDGKLHTCFISIFNAHWIFYVKLFIYRLCELLVSDGFVFWLLLFVQEMLL